jgi:glutamine synthetase
MMAAGAGRGTGMPLAPLAQGADDVRELCREYNVQFMQLQFTDILGSIKHVDLPVSLLDKALAGDVIFDGSAIEGFVRTRESDMYLRPDPRTFTILPWKSERGVTARMICDVHNLDGSPFPGDPRHALKRVCAEAESMGFTCQAGPEPEFFLFRRDAAGRATTETNDLASYFDVAPLDIGESVREEIVTVLQNANFEVQGSHHEAAPGQHEIDFKYADALTTADRFMTFRLIVRVVAAQRGLHATFMPKPLADVNGSGLHVHQSLFRDGVNAFYDERGPDKLSSTARHYLAGLLAHARGFTAVTNPLVNSYKRLVPGYEAPTFVTWSHREHSPMVRIPARRGVGTRLEVRSPDPACNPYLALAVLFKSGLDGIKQRMEPPKQAGVTVYRMTPEERRELGIEPLPADLNEALAALEEDVVVQSALGEHIFTRFVEAKRIEWDYYRRQVHRWELDQYLVAF